MLSELGAMASLSNVYLSPKSQYPSSFSSAISPCKSVCLVSPKTASDFQLKGVSMNLDLFVIRGNHHGRAWKCGVQLVPIMAVQKSEPLKIMIAGAPASGKGTQCELITKKVIFCVPNIRHFKEIAKWWERVVRYFTKSNLSVQVGWF